jgi:putative ABC transport system substrate-binding protein
MNNRRKLIIALGAGALSAPFASHAQQKGKVWRVGFLSGVARPDVLESSFLGGFLQGMRELGHVEGRDFIMEWRFAEARADRYAELAAELIRLNVDVVVTGSPQAARAVQSAGPHMPIVLGVSTDPVGSGFAASLAHPGGNITGIANSVDDSSPKQLELLVAAVPKVSRLGLLVNSTSPNYLSVLKPVQASAKQARLTLVTADAKSAEEFSDAFAALHKARVQALMVMSDVLFNNNRSKIAALAISHRLPSMFSVREYVVAGGLMSYGESFREFFRRAAFYVDKIFKGAKPGDLPIEQPNRFYLTINLKTAKNLGIKIPQSLLLRADEVIE